MKASDAEFQALSQTLSFMEEEELSKIVSFQTAELDDSGWHDLKTWLIETLDAMPSKETFENRKGVFSVISRLWFEKQKILKAAIKWTTDISLPAGPLYLPGMSKTKEDRHSKNNPVSTNPLFKESSLKRIWSIVDE